MTAPPGNMSISVTAQSCYEPSHPSTPPPTPQPNSSGRHCLSLPMYSGGRCARPSHSLGILGVRRADAHCLTRRPEISRGQLWSKWKSNFPFAY